MYRYHCNYLTFWGQIQVYFMYFESKHLVTFPRRNYFCLLTLIQATQQYYAILHDTVLRTNANVHCTRSNHAPLPLPFLNPPPHHHDACDSNNKTATACRIYNTAELLLAARQHGQKKFRGAKEGRQIDGKSGHSAAWARLTNGWVGSSGTEWEMGG